MISVNMKNWLSLLGSTLTFAWFINFVIMFTIAYLSPTKSVHIFINTIGEANIEMAMLMISIPLAFFGLKDAIEKVMEKGVKA